MKSVGAYEAKTKLSRFLREVEQGEEFVITRWDGNELVIRP